jgi:hypothetical protein
MVFLRWNPFERFYDWAIGRPRALAPLEPTPGPQRIVQGMATAFTPVSGWRFPSAGTRRLMCLKAYWW